MSDAVGPRLVDLRFPGQVSLANGATSADLFFSAEDSDGITQIQVELQLRGSSLGADRLTSTYFPSGSQPLWTSGERKQGLQIGARQKEGTYEVVKVTLVDRVGNVTVLDDELAGLSLTSRTLTVTDRDNTAPELTLFDIEQTQVDVSSGSKPLSISVNARDVGGSGISHCYIQYYKDDPNIFKEMTIFQLEDGAGRGVENLSTTTEDGTYQIKFARISDNNGNTRNYTTAELAAKGWDTSFTVIKDKVAPELTSLDLTDLINVAGSPGRLSIAATASDVGAGVASVTVFFAEQIPGYPYGMTLFGQENGWLDGKGSESITIPQTMAAGTYNVLKVVVFDNGGNKREYLSGDLGAGFDKSFTVVKDSAAPTLTRLDFPATVDIAQGAAAFRLEAGAADTGGSGVARVSVRFAGDPFGSIGGWIQLDGDAQGWADGTGIVTLALPADTPVGTYQLEAVQLVDHGGNVTSYTAAQLSGTAFDKSFTVTNGDRTAPTLLGLDFPAAVDLAGTFQDIAFTGRASDGTGTGVASMTVAFDRPLGDNQFIVLNGAGDSWADGTSSVLDRIPAGTTPGTYSVASVKVRDLAGNERTYLASELPAGIPRSITVTDSGTSTDEDAPVPVSLTGSTVIDLRSGAKPLSFAAQATDATGVEALTVFLDKPVKLAAGTFSGITLGGDGDDWADGSTSGSVTVAIGAAPGAYELASLEIADTLGHGATLSAAAAWTQYGIDVGFLVLDGSIAVAPAEVRRGTPGAETLVGTAANNVLFTLAGDDTLDGAGGSDWLYGGSGSDTYLVSAGDLVFEDAGRGSDWVRTTTTYALRAGSEVERLSVFDAAGLAAINLAGNEFSNALTGNAGANLLDGRGGEDVMTGLGGADTFLVDDAEDEVVEAADGGLDTVLAGVSYALAAGASVERLFAADAAATSPLALAGNEFVNFVRGNAGENRIDGGTGADTLQGLLGDDVYFVDNAGDVVLETANQGFDAVYATVSYALRAGQSVEVLATTDFAGTVKINLTGNELANDITGNHADNILDGRGGADTMTGGTGNDTYFVDHAGDRVSEADVAGVDHVRSSVTYTLTAFVENLTLTGLAAINGTGNELANVVTGNGAANTLDGGTGADRMAGGGGDDIYVVDQAGDVVIEAANAGTDTVRSAVTWTLGANCENLTLAGTLAIDGTGNELANTVTGNGAANVLRGLGGADILFGGGGGDTLEGGEGADRLDGGGEADSMTGGTGDDVYVVNVAGDLTIEAADGGTDQVQSAVTRTLGANLENLVLTGAAAVAGTGNTLNNRMQGNGAANALSGLGGNDILQGFGGNDTLNGGDGLDDLYGGAGSDQLTGGTGTDFFSFDTALDASTNVDRIVDFSSADDFVALDDAIFGDLRAAAGESKMDARFFRLGPAAVDADDRIICDSTGGAVLFDADGVGGAAAVRFATVNAGLVLRAVDFYVF